jgi:hypothetical protein
VIAGCPAPQHPGVAAAPAFAIEVGRAGASLRAIAGDGAMTFAAFALTAGHGSVVEARRGEKIAWTTPLAGAAATLAHGRDVVIAGTVGDPALRGEPGATVTALDSRGGAVRWSTTIDSTEWALVTSVAATDDGCVVGGSFAGTLRIGASVVTSAGGSDGFVARLGAKGEVRWLERLGGIGADAVQGVAVRGEQIAIAGTFAAGAELAGEALVPQDDRTAYADGFVAELDANGARRWVASFGSRVDDAIAGVAIDDSGRVAVAATAREVVHLGASELVAHGEADAMIAWWQDGKPGGGLLLGGPGFDGAGSIVAVGDRFAIGGFFSGSLRLGDRVLEAGGGDDAFVAVVEAGHIASALQAGGAGREEIAALAAVPGGFIAGVTHSANATVDGAPLPAPADPMAGAALVGRGAR